jgi:hypothetical protein
MTDFVEFQNIYRGFGKLEICDQVPSHNKPFVCKKSSWFVTSDFSVCKPLCQIDYSRKVVAIRADAYPLLWMWYWFKVFVIYDAWEKLNQALYFFLRDRLNSGVDFIHPAVSAPRNPIKMLYYFAMNKGKTFDNYLK